MSIVKKIRFRGLYTRGGPLGAPPLLQILLNPILLPLVTLYTVILIRTTAHAARARRGEDAPRPGSGNPKPYFPYSGRNLKPIFI